MVSIRKLFYTTIDAIPIAVIGFFVFMIIYKIFFYEYEETLEDKQDKQMIYSWMEKSDKILPDDIKFRDSDITFFYKIDKETLNKYHPAYVSRCLAKFEVQEAIKENYRVLNIEKFKLLRVHLSIIEKESNKRVGTLEFHTWTRIEDFSLWKEAKEKD